MGTTIAEQKYYWLKILRAVYRFAPCLESALYHPWYWQDICHNITCCVVNIYIYIYIKIYSIQLYLINCHSVYSISWKLYSRRCFVLFVVCVFICSLSFESQFSANAPVAFIMTSWLLRLQWANHSTVSCQVIPVTHQWALLQRISNFIPHFTGHMTTYPPCYSR